MVALAAPRELEEFLRGAQGGIRTPVARKGATFTASCIWPLYHLRMRFAKRCQYANGTNYTNSTNRTLTKTLLSKELLL